MRNAIASFFASLALLTPTLAGADVIPIYRLYSINNGDHLFTQQCTEAMSVQRTSGFVLEGIGFYVWDSNGPGLAPFYRVLLANSHFYTADPNEFANVLHGGGVSENIIGYVQPTPGPDRVALFRLVRTTDNFHFYTSNSIERDYVITNLGFRLEGVAGYVPPSGSEKCTVSRIFAPTPPPSGPKGCWQNYECGTLSDPRTCHAWDPHCPG
jgi:hypothetical protein